MGRRVSRSKNSTHVSTDSSSALTALLPRHQESTIRVSEVQLVLKWGGELTKAGKQQAWPLSATHDIHAEP